jgi:hypothetical protein
LQFGKIYAASAEYLNGFGFAWQNRGDRQEDVSTTLKYKINNYENYNEPKTAAAPSPACITSN